MIIKKYSLSDPEIANDRPFYKHFSTFGVIIFVCSLIIFYLVLARFDHLIDQSFLEGEVLFVDFSLICLMAAILCAKLIQIARARKASQMFRCANQKWLSFLDIAQKTLPLKDLPSLASFSPIDTCLLSYMPTQGMSNQYEFSNSEEATDFCSRHRQILIDRLRNALGSEFGARRLAIGLIEHDEDQLIFIFRQISEECAVFFTVRHRQIGTVINLITHRWAVYNRQAAPHLGRRMSDSEFVQRLNTGDVDTRRKVDWGSLGKWHWIAHWNFENGKADTSASDSELDYYEKIVHVETVKDAKQKQPMPPMHSQVPAPRGDAKISPPEDFL